HFKYIVGNMNQTSNERSGQTERELREHSTKRPKATNETLAPRTFHQTAEGHKRNENTSNSPPNGRRPQTDCEHREQSTKRPKATNSKARLASFTSLYRFPSPPAQPFPKPATKPFLPR